MSNLTEKQLIAIPEHDRDQQGELDRWLEMFALFIHDLESPLATMKYVLKLVGEGKLDTSKSLHRELIGSCYTALERAETILYDVMSVAKAGKVGIPVACRPIDPDPVIREAISLVTASSLQQGITIEYSSIRTPLLVHADPDLLKRALDNLCYNAIRHTPQGNKIRIYLEEEGESAFIHVKDNGPGLGDIDPELLFEKYGQLQLRAAGQHRGVGLGLYFCKLAATGMGGTIIAHDHIEGGAVFTLRLRKV